MRDLLMALSQEHLIAEANTFPSEAQNRLRQQLGRFQPADVARQKQAFAHMHEKTVAHDDPWTDVALSGSATDRAAGEALLRQGKVGCIILAGGQGSRLGFEGPKGMIPVTPLHKKSLFQLFAERAKAASQRYGSSLPLCVMTSPLNHQQTVDYFAEQNNFGLLPDQLFFMQQNMLPLLNDEGGWLFAGPGRLAEGPNGNGEALRHFCEQGIFANWHARGVEWVNVILVDNALADPFDAEFVGYASRRQSEVALKAVERLSPTEQMGVLVSRSGQLKVVEYSEFVPDGREYAYSSTSLFSFSMPFISRLYLEGQKKEMPLHLARKCVTIDSGKVHIWKCESFIFDLLDEARSAAVLVCPRENIYAPLKNAQGDKSLSTVQEALMHFDRKFYESVTGTPVGDELFELDPALYYP
ncbi:MAG: UTP--glucose-1-phosphate uridylyltransferase [Chlamydiota bacterium]